MCWQHRIAWFSLAICLGQSSLLVCPLNSTLCPHKSDVYTFLLACQCIGVHTGKWLMISFLFPLECLVCLDRRWWFERSEVCGHTAVVLPDAASRLCLKHYIAELCRSHLIFLSDIPFKSLWCNDTLSGHRDTVFFTYPVSTKMLLSKPYHQSRQ